MDNILYKCDVDVNNLITWDIDPMELIKLTQKRINDSRIVYDYIAQLKGKMICYENIIDRLQDENTIMKTFYCMASFLQYVSSNEELREASLECDKLLNDYFIELFDKQDVFNTLNTFHNKLEQSEKFKTKFPEDYRYIQRIIRDYKRSGINLPNDKKDELQKISKQISNLEINFSNNLNKVDTILLFTEKELDGLSKDFIDSLPKIYVNKNQTHKTNNLTLSEEEKLVIDQALNIDINKVLKCEVSLKYPIYKPCMKKVTVDSTRKLLAYEFNRRCIDKNLLILLKLIELRDMRAKILGYSNHLDYVTEILVSKNGQNVINFINNLIEKTSENGKYDIKKLESIKNDYINQWDIIFYKDQIEKKEYNIDSDKLKEYFPLEHIIKKTLEIYQKLLSLKFVENNNKSIWHQSVNVFDVYDTSTSNDNDYIGTFYLDLYPRKFKYNHAACFPLQPACHFSNGTKLYPLSAILTNFTKPTKDKPSLLNFDEVITFFHEFGHVMHQLLGRTKFSLFSGSATETDFVEAPSQMFENWCWEKDSIKIFSKHYHTGNQLDDKTIQNLLNIKNLLNGFHLRKQLCLSKFDILIHSDQKLISILKESKNEKVKSKIIYNIYKNLEKNLVGVPTINNTFFPASFEHIAGGYDAQYYSYIWSEVYAADMFYEKFKGNLLNEHVGLSYRKLVLEIGGAKDAKDIMHDFLNREPSIYNFLKSKGLDTNNINNINVNVLKEPQSEDYIRTSDSITYNNNNNTSENDLLDTIEQ